MLADVIIIGAGAAGLMCAISAAERGKKVLILDHANKAGKKILISGGGRCNFTNLYTEPENYLSENPHFCKSALSRYTQWDFIAEVDRVGLAWHEEKHGHLFSDEKSSAILALLLDKCEALGIDIKLACHIHAVEKHQQGHFVVTSSLKTFQSQALVIATGAMSFPTMGASDFGHTLAKQFDLNVTATRPGLVPFTFDAKEKKQFEGLSGIHFMCEMQSNGKSFYESMIFTHKGISGPATLQVSSYWQAGDTVTVNCLPSNDVSTELKSLQMTSPNKKMSNVLQQYLAQRLVSSLCQGLDIDRPLQHYKHQELETIAARFHQWQFIPSGTEGYKKAEVTLGGVDTQEVSSKTFEAKKVKGLYFIGEVLDVTGQLGGFNFQWAWSSGYCCGQSL